MAAIVTTLCIFVFGQVVTGLVWALRLEGKVNVADQRGIDLKELIVVQLDSIDKRLSRIERSMNGKLRHD